MYQRNLPFSQLQTLKYNYRKINFASPCFTEWVMKILVAWTLSSHTLTCETWHSTCWILVLSFPALTLSIEYTCRCPILVCWLGLTAQRHPKACFFLCTCMCVCVCMRMCVYVWVVCVCVCVCGLSIIGFTS